MGGCIPTFENDEAYNNTAHIDQVRQPNTRQKNKGENRHINPSEQSDPRNIPQTNPKSIGVSQTSERYGKMQICVPEDKFQNKITNNENEKQIVTPCNPNRELNVKNSLAPKSLRNLGRVCYMLSTIQCVSACFSVLPIQFEKNPAGELFSSLINSGDVDTTFRNFLDAYQCQFSDFNIIEEYDAKEFFLRLIAVLGTKISSYFITMKINKVECIKHHHITEKKDETAFYDFGALENFESVYMNYFSLGIQEKIQFCIKCNTYNLCKVDDTYRLPDLRVFYFNSSYKITIEALAYKLSQKNLNLLGIIKRISTTTNSGHFIAYVLIDRAWFICNDSIIHEINQEEYVEPYMIFSKSHENVSRNDFL